MSIKINTNDAKTLVAIDQHARTSTLYAIDKQTGELKSKRFTNCPRYTEFIDWLDTWASKPYYFAYESGPCGFTLARNLRAANHACDVIAVSSIPRSTKDKVMKDDFLDARSLLAAIEAKSSALSCVYVPSVFAEDARDVVRQYYHLSKNLRRAKQFLSAHLLRHDFVYDEKTKAGRPKKMWTCDHERWLQNVKLETEFQRDVLVAAYDEVQELTLQVRDAMRKVEELAKAPEFAKYVDCFCAIKGVGVLTAVTFCAEIDDFSRFKKGRSIASYIGLVPKRHNSGDSHRNGAINKCGDKTLRRALIEGFSAVSNFSARSVDRRVLGKLPLEVRTEIEKVNKRIVNRYKTLKANGKNHNVIKVALAKEAACQMLYIAQKLDRLEANCRL
ncbi:MAG: IS110 family transposase [Phoenicibacter congonensis]|uniref:IS110 family transposase n=1 Tax=Phoenicibacter congonensis TaxID=1944646 RepID=A0AA43RJ31_9ACTN|nr:IS110 family transposase [Phoenicibacter congonensis]